MPGNGQRQRSARTHNSRRAWGWHPLQPEWAARVVDAAGIRKGDLVVDLGAGTGALTAPLVAAGAKVIAVELHPRRAQQLRERFADADVVVVRADLAEFRWPRRTFRVVASPPYSLSTPLVRALVGVRRLVSADLVLQDAAARRLASNPPGGRYARAYEVSLGMPVPRRAFSPPPKVDSRILQIRRT